MIHTIPETGSTSADLADRLRAGDYVREGDWLVAERQTRGRGRLGREWLDGSGNFMGSTIVRLNSADPPPQTLALVAGLALRDAVIPHLGKDFEARLKWPNDLMIGQAKLAGILLELVEDAVIVGIGVNLQAAPDLPDRPAIALSHCGQAPRRDTFARLLAERFASELEHWRGYGLAQAISRWLERAHPIGTQLDVTEPDGKRLNGEFAGLDREGILQLRLADGSMRAIHAGEVLLAPGRK